ncbi:MAG: hypothetical protein MZV70_28590 [Desulfobacterales bacterium]|nr:hypothetical protein [Desulfobacterales bacterium]
MWPFPPSFRHHRPVLRELHRPVRQHRCRPVYRLICRPGQGPTLPRKGVITQGDAAFRKPQRGSSFAFGPDGFLYVGMGDGDALGETLDGPSRRISHPCPGNRGLLGKLLRLDVEAGTVPYAIPVTNPLVGGTRSEIWARRPSGIPGGFPLTGSPETSPIGDDRTRRLRGDSTSDRPPPGRAGTTDGGLAGGSPLLQSAGRMQRRQSYPPRLRIQPRLRGAARSPAASSIGAG